MYVTILPCFGPGRHEAEGNAIGRMLAGYGELELEMTLCVAAAIKDLDGALRKMFCTRGEDRRIKVARSNLKLPAASAKLEAVTERILGDMEWCKAIRNQYAHCQWFPIPGGDLTFVNFEEVALIIGPIGPLENYKNKLDLDLLTKQEAYFAYVRTSFWYLAESFKSWATGWKDRVGGSSSPLFPLPPIMERPPLHI